MIILTRKLKSGYFSWAFTPKHCTWFEVRPKHYQTAVDEQSIKPYCQDRDKNRILRIKP